MNLQGLTYNDLPQAMGVLFDKLERIEHLLTERKNTPAAPVQDQWLNLDELCGYLPSHPKKQTVYQWTACKKIPYSKRGGHLLFNKREIDEWLHSSRKLTVQELRSTVQEETDRFLGKRKK